MSSPNTDIEKQVKRHRPSLGGIAIALGAAALVLVVVALWSGVPREEQAAPDTPAAEG